jgi:hypothetical protein
MLDQIEYLGAVADERRKLNKEYFDASLSNQNKLSQVVREL